MSSTILFLFTPQPLHRFLGAIIIVIHQHLLNSGLKQFVLFGYNGDAARKGLLESNREGIVSSVGFVAIYFVGVQLGTILLKKRFVSFFSSQIGRTLLQYIFLPVLKSCLEASYQNPIPGSTLTSTYSK